MIGSGDRTSDKKRLRYIGNRDGGEDVGLLK